MSTLEVACGKCERRFRVRAEFAGRATRCPGCSAPITVGGSPRPAPPARIEPPDRPRPRPRPDEQNESRQPTADWRPVDTALGREQAAVLLLLVTFLTSPVAWGLGSVTSSFGPAQPVFLAVMLLLVFGPILAAGVFGLAARLAALRVPAASRSKGTTVASLLCALAGLGSLLVLGLAFLFSIGSFGPAPLIVPVAATGATAAGIGAVATFGAFVAQVGIARRSADVSWAFGRTAVGFCVSLLAVLGISYLMALASAMSSPDFGTRSRDGEIYIGVVMVVLIPMALAVLLILYHRLLAAGRRAVQGEPAGRYDG